MTWDDTLFSSANHDWVTPVDLFFQLHEEFHFDLDAAATEAAARVRMYLGPDADDLDDRDALRTNWDREGVQTVWLNPPYGRGVGRWLQKVCEESREGLTIVCLLMARTDTAWFHDFAMQAAEIRFIRGRIKFLDGETLEPRNPAPAPSMLVIFRPGSSGPPIVSSYDQ